MTQKPIILAQGYRDEKARWYYPKVRREARKRDNHHKGGEKREEMRIGITVIGIQRGPG